MDTGENRGDRLIDLLDDQLDQKESAQPEQPDPPKAEPMQPAQPEPPQTPPVPPVPPAPPEKPMSRHQQKKLAKARAKDDVRELAREIKADKKMRKIERHQWMIEEREKYPTGSLRRKARHLRWKKEKADRRQALKDRYRDAPWIIRVCRLYLLKPFIALLIIAAIAAGGTAYFMTNGAGLFQKFLTAIKNQPATQEQIYALSPIDADGAKRIDAVAPVDKDDTWTISVYIVGADLEDMGEDDLSAVIKTQIADIREKTQKASVDGYATRLSNFSEELDKNDLEIPAYLFYPNKPVKSESDEEQEGPVIAEDPGCASNDIGEMTSETWPDNINIVIQTGGATRWSNARVNPNRTQRFLYHDGAFKEVDDLPLQPASNAKTLTSFLNFCKKEYPADHNMLILWNHGGGAFGYGVDSIYGNMMSLADIREALEGAYEPSEKDPAFDIIGFDACLMSSLEVVHALDGFASYYAVSEETEPGEGWDYAPWLKAMAKDPTLSPAKVCQNIADSYMDYYMTQNVNIGWLYSNDVTFSVLDASKTEKLYDAWCDLTRQQLIDAATDNSVLSEIGRCVGKSTHYVTSVYNIYNTIDLGSYVDLMADTYPQECSRIKKLIGESVMYHRENGSLSDSQGISVYLPGSVENYGGLAYCLDYIYNICEDPSTQALYYYKIAGCLNEDMQEYLATLTDDQAKVLDLKPFRQFAKAEPVITDNGFEIEIGDKLQSMLASYELETAFINQDAGTILNYGRDETVRLDGEGTMDCEFDGKWICYDGVPLATEVVASTDSTVEYRAKVLYNGTESYLMFTYDRDSEEFVINGVRNATESNAIFSMDQYNYLINSRMTLEVKKGDEIIPIYDVSYIDQKAKKSESEKKRDGQGETIKVSKRSKITVDKLDGGYYVTAAVIGDPRGDVYYSQVVGNKVSGGSVKERVIDTDYLARDY